MANILDYLDWRGDVPFSAAPLNEIDNLIFSELSFIDLKDVLSPRVADGGMPLHQAAARFFELHPDDNESMGLIVPADIRVLIRRMAECSRYRDLMLFGFVNTIDENVQKQFAALTIEIDPHLLYVTFRGTDDTLVGWIENFHMSFMEAIPAQLDAVAYLNQVAADADHPRIIVGGHSKGGNLAIYAAIHCEEEVRSRIERVYSNDGPGYRQEIIASPEYMQMQERIVNIVPQSSIIGRLLEHDNRYTVVHSTASGLWQHDGFSWEVKGTSFVPAAELSAESERIDRSVKKWMTEMTAEEREKFVEALYVVLTSTNAKTLTELTQDRNWLWRLLTNGEITESRKTVLAGLTRFTGEAGKLWIESMLPAKKKPNVATEETREEDVAHSPSEKKQETPLPRASTKKAKLKMSRIREKGVPQVCETMCKKAAAVVGVIGQKAKAIEKNAVTATKPMRKTLQRFCLGRYPVKQSARCPKCGRVICSPKTGPTLKRNIKPAKQTDHL